MSQRKLRCCLQALTITLQAHTASAWDSQTTGKIAVIEATSLNSYAFRIWLEDSPVLCSGGHRWAYVEGVNCDYKMPVSTLPTVKARDVSVATYTLNDASGANHCRIEHIVISD